MISLTKSKESVKGLIRENKAQAEAVFRLMIDSVIGLAILLVILSALGYFQDQELAQSKTDLVTLVDNAVNSPTGFIFKSKELTFPNKFSIDVIDLQNWTSLSENCFFLQAKSGSIITIDDKKIQFTQKLKTIVYAQCKTIQGCDLYTNPDSPNLCCTPCIISFGLPIEAD